MPYCLAIHAHTHLSFHALSHATWVSWNSHVVLCPSHLQSSHLGRLCHLHSSNSSIDISDRLHTIPLISFAYLSSDPLGCILSFVSHLWLMPQCLYVVSYCLECMVTYGATWGHGYIHDVQLINDVFCHGATWGHLYSHGVVIQSSWCHIGPLVLCLCCL